MRQVPGYLIIGDGRMAKHFCHYLDLLNIPYQQWSRRTDPTEKKLPNLIQQSKRILLLINDSAIEPFIQTHPQFQNKTVIHFSGKLTTKLACGTHPLCCFTNETYLLKKYRGIPFVCEQGNPLFNKLLPGLDNPHYYITVEQKNLYHALCVISGNFTVLLWQKMFSKFEETFNIPKEAAFPYLEQTLTNLLRNSDNALTGPLVRGDTQTIAANLAALEGDPYQKIYQLFVETYQQSKTIGATS